MNIKRRLSNRSSDTVYTMQFSEKLKLLDLTKKEMENMVDELERFVKGLNEDNSANRFEKPGEKLRGYGRTCTDGKSGDGFEIMKKCFDEIGRLHRLFSNEVEERCIVPLKEWIRVDYRKMKTEVERLDELRKSMDQAANDARRRPNDQNAQLRDGEAQGSHQKQVVIVETEVFKRLDDDLLRLAKIWKRFCLIEATLYRDVRNCLQEAIDHL